MKAFKRMVWLPALWFTAALAYAGAAPPELAGTWQGKLAVDPRTSLTIQFTFAKQPNGSYTAVLNSPDNGAIKNTPASGVTWDGSNLKLQVASLSGAYAGTLKDGRLDGKWSQQGSDLPLVLSPYQKPVLTKASIDALSGGWTGSFDLMGAKTVIQVNFKPDGKGDLLGTFSLPDRGLNDAPVNDLQVEGGKVSFKVPRPPIEFNGNMAGGEIKGGLKVPAPGTPPDGIPVSLKRGEYKPPVVTLKMSTEAYAALNGKWEGPLELTNPQGAKVKIRLVMRFNTTRNGQYVGFIDSPDQGATNLPITELTFADNKVTMKIDAVKGEFAGTVAGNAMTGEWSQGPLKLPLVLKR